MAKRSGKNYHQRVAAAETEKEKIEMVSNINDSIPDVRDGLNRKERIILYCPGELQKEPGDRNVPTVMLYGRVVEEIDIGMDEFQTIIAKFVR